MSVRVRPSAFFLFMNIQKFIEAKRRSFFVYTVKSPSLAILNTFLFLIIFGALILLLPVSHKSNISIHIIDALFTATSAVCVTGLTVIDTGSSFSIFGQIIILFLIQSGALGIILFSYIGSFLSRRNLSLNDKLNISFTLGNVDLTKLYATIRNIVLFTFFFEFIGAILLFFAFIPTLGFSLNNFFISLFHSISAYCNAGFSLFTDNLVGYQDNIPINLIISLLIITGGLSFVVIFNLKDFFWGLFAFHIKKRNTQVPNLNLNTKIVLFLTVCLIIGGTLAIYHSEHNNLIKDHNIFTQYLIALFQSVSSRTAGFNSIDLSFAKVQTYLVIIFLMFIGGASGSCAGGVKVNTIGVILAHLLSILRNRRSTILNKKSIPTLTVNRSLLIVFIGIFIIFFATLLLMFTEPFQPIKIFFETVSAFGTVGLSGGITSQLSFIGKTIIISIMLIGRIGLITLLTLLTSTGPSPKVFYPSEDICVG